MVLSYVYNNLCQWRASSWGFLWLCMPGDCLFECTFQQTSYCRGWLGRYPKICRIKSRSLLHFLRIHMHVYLPTTFVILGVICSESWLRVKSRFCIKIYITIIFNLIQLFENKMGWIVLRKVIMKRSRNDMHCLIGFFSDSRGGSHMFGST